jgi:hypothetical protein
VNAREILAIDEAIRTVISDAVARRCPEEIAVARAVAIAIAGPVEVAPVERSAERRDRVNAQMLRQLQQLEREGKGRASVGILARKLAHDLGDPAEVEAISKHLRRLRLRQKNSAQCAVKRLSTS